MQIKVFEWVKKFLLAISVAGMLGGGLLLYWMHDRQEKLNRVLIKAVARGDAYSVRESLAKGADPDCGGVYDLPPLHDAVKKGHYEIVKILIEYGADVDRRTSNDLGGATPLEHASALEDASGYRIASHLLNSGADLSQSPGALVDSAIDGKTPLIKLYLAKPITLSIKLKALERSAYCNQLKSVELLTPEVGKNGDWNYVLREAKGESKVYILNYLSRIKHPCLPEMKQKYGKQIKLAPQTPEGSFSNKDSDSRSDNER